MAKTKISKVAKDLNIALQTAIDFLEKKNIQIDHTPNARIEDDVVAMLMSEFSNDKDFKTKTDNMADKIK